MSKPKIEAATPLDETCTYCDRVRWGSYVYLVNGHWRHAECYPGSKPWREWYAKLPKNKRTSAGDHLFNHNGGI